MANLAIKEPPEYEQNIRKWDRDTMADGLEMGNDVEKVFQNTWHNYRTLEGLRAIYPVFLDTSAWSSTAPYEQVVQTGNDVRATDSPILGPYTTADMTVQEVRLNRKMAGLITYASCGDGSIRFLCHNKRPTESFTVALKGVTTNYG